jgi:hypothetical protein
VVLELGEVGGDGSSTRMVGTVGGLEDPQRPLVVGLEGVYTPTPDRQPRVAAGASVRELEQALTGQVLAVVELVGTYGC